MPSTILSDNGVSSGSAGLKTTAASDGSLALQTTTAAGTATTAVTIDTGQNVGVGVTPSAWNTGSKAIQIGSQGAIEYRGNATSIAMNAYYDSVGWKYITSNAASLYFQYLNSHTWSVAPSGTAGNAISFTTAMVLDASGNLGIGTTSPSQRLHVVSSGTTPLNLVGSTACQINLNDGTQNANWGLGVGGVGITGIASPSTYPLVFYTNGAERARIDSSGNLLVGRTSLSSGSNSKVEVEGRYSSFSQGTAGYNFGVSGTAFTISDNTSGVPVERMRIDSNGNVLVGNTSYNSTLKGILLSNNGRLYATADGIPSGTFCRLSSNGNLIEFQRDNINVGTISVTTTATSYNTSSDYRLKHDIAQMTGALAKVAALKPVTYKWNVDDSDGEGFIAHELAEVMPHAVTGAKDAVDADGNPVYQGIDTSFLIATLTAAIQELKAEFDAYKATHP